VPGSRSTRSRSAAKALAAARELPFAAVDHLHGHLAAGFIGPAPFEPPFVSLIASGGHTMLARVEDHGPAYELLGQTLDDAAGEAFDKGARMLGLGYPGGPALERLAAGGDPEAFAFPIGGRRADSLDFSFAGLKTALLYKIRDLGEADTERRRADLAASYQHAIVEALVLRVERALTRTGLQRLAIGGGVAANGPLRERLSALGVPIDVPPRELCTDNAAMIASAARYVPAIRFPGYVGLDVYASGERAPV
jgi:N6-L-threonylcarbamoyladenine synthase